MELTTIPQNARQKTHRWLAAAVFFTAATTVYAADKLPTPAESLRKIRQTIDKRVEKIRHAPPQQLEWDNNFRWSVANWTSLRSVMGDLTEELYGEHFLDHPGLVLGSDIRLDGLRFADGLVAEVLPDGRLLIREFWEMKSSIGGHNPALTQVSENLQRLSRGKTLKLGSLTFTMDQVVLASRDGLLTPAALAKKLPEVFAPEATFSTTKASKELQDTFPDHFVRILVPGTAGTNGVDPRFPFLEQGHVTEQALAEKLASHFAKLLPEPVEPREILTTVRAAIGWSMSRRLQGSIQGDADVATFLAAPGEVLLQFLGGEKDHQRRQFPAIARGFDAMVRSQYPKLSDANVDEVVSELFLGALEFHRANRTSPKLRHQLPAHLLKKVLPAAAGSFGQQNPAFDLRRHDVAERAPDDYIFNLPFSEEQTRPEFLEEWIQPILQKGLDPRARGVLKLRLGVDGTPQTLEEISMDYGLTRERIVQICARALRSLGVELGKSRRLADYPDAWEKLLKTRLERSRPFR